MANIDNVQLPDGSSYNIVDNTSGFATQNYVDSAVSSVTKTTIGLGNVDNTSDLNKPISTATQAALDTLDEGKADKTDIATVESGTTASRPYSVGELVYVSGTLYRVKTAIASGATFTVGTNIEVTNVSNAIKEVDRGSVSVTADGVKTYGALFNELFALVDFSKINANSMLQYGSGEVCVCRLVSPTAIYFENTNVEANSFTAAKIVLRENGSMIVILSITYSPLAATPTDYSALVPAANATFTVYY